MINTDNFPKVEVESSTDLRTWLAQNHDRSESVWLVTYKKSVPDKYVSISEVLDELLCFGWIDGIRRVHDDVHKTMQLISPRKTQHWAQTYKDRVAKLIKDDRMHNAGLRVIEISKEKGLWDFMDDVDKLIIPTDLQNVLREYKGATDFFNSINDSSKRFALRWLKLAKTEKTRVSRIVHLAELAAKGEKLKGS